MTDLYFGVVTSPFLWIAVTTLAVLLALQSITTTQVKARPVPFGRWIRLNYWKLMLGVGVLLGIVAAIFYLVEIGAAVRSIVDRLREASAPDAKTPAEDFRSYATAIAVLLGALAAAATLIFQLVRVWIAERTTTTAEQSLITDLINTAVEGLGAEKTVKRIVDSPDGTKTTEEETVPNIEVRVGAIYTLERIAQDSDRDHVQIMEILTAYIRENSPVERAAPSPLPASEYIGLFPTEEQRAAQREAQTHRLKVLRDRERPFQQWINALTCRTDIQAAAQVIGRRTAQQIALERSDSRYGAAGYSLDLRATNLRAVDVSGLDLRNARLVDALLEGANLERAHLEAAFLWEAHLEGATLKGAHLEEAKLAGAHLEGAYLEGAHLEGANLKRAHLEKADLEGAHLEGAYLERAQIDAATSLTVAILRGAAVMAVDWSDCTTDRDHLVSRLAEAFGDASVKLPHGLKAGDPPLDHWPPKKLDFSDFFNQWRAFQKSIGYTPPE